jgi:hypothetical protein
MSRAFAVGGIAGVAVAVVLVGALHVLPPSSQVDPVRRTISQYALLETAAVFNVAVLALAAGSVATMLALIVGGLLPVRSGAAVALASWTVGLAVVVYFPKHNWAVGPSPSGTVHRVASVVAFLSLPVAALLLARAWRGHPRWSGHAALVMTLGILSLACFAPIAVAVAIEPVTGVRWWRAIPLGAVERALALTEVLTVLSLAWWSARAARRPASAGTAG